jgi:hypothetical protein
MDVRTIRTKQKFKLKDVFLDISLLSDLCLGGGWSLKWSNTDLVLDEHRGPPQHHHSIILVNRQV